MNLASPHPRTRVRLLLLLPALAVLGAGPAGDAPIYSNDFAQAALGKPADDAFLVLAGEFAVKDAGDDGRVMELAGTPVDAFGALFGPTLDEATCNVFARVWGATTGRRFPEFGVGSNDVGGYKLWLMPRTRQVAIRKGEATVATAPCETWQSETWTRFRLQVSKTSDDAWTVRGKVWPASADEPEGWSVSFDEREAPAAGRASVWGNPYSGRPIRFDDLRVTK